jgi:Uncharacterized protein family, UPF0114
MREEQADRAGNDTGPDAVLAEPAARGDGNAAGAPPPGRALDRLEDGFERFLVLARLLVLVPVIILVLAAVAAFVYATVVFAVSIPGIIEHPLPGPKLALFVLEIDVFLIGATLIIAAFGFYELFISKIDPARGRLRLPGWLKIRDLNDLKARGGVHADPGRRRHLCEGHTRGPVRGEHPLSRGGRGVGGRRAHGVPAVWLPGAGRGLTPELPVRPAELRGQYAQHRFAGQIAVVFMLQWRLCALTVSGHAGHWLAADRA